MPIIQKNKNTILGLPSEYYNNKTFWKSFYIIIVERNITVLSNNWLFVAFAHDLKNPGDAYPVSIAGKPILIIKDQKNKISAFHNVCSH